MNYCNVSRPDVLATVEIPTGTRCARLAVEEALIEMFLVGVSVRHVEDITETLWGSKVSPSTTIELNKKAYVHSSCNCGQ